MKRHLYRLTTPRKTMDSVEIETEDNGHSWTCRAGFQGLTGQRLAVFTQFTEAVRFASEMGADIARDRHLITQTNITKM